MAQILMTLLMFFIGLTYLKGSPNEKVTRKLNEKERKAFRKKQAINYFILGTSCFLCTSS